MRHGYTCLVLKKKGMEGYTSQLCPMLKEDASQLSSTLKKEALQSSPSLKDGIVSRNTALHVESSISMM